MRWLQVSMACDCDWTTVIPASEPPYLYGDGMNVWDMLATGEHSGRHACMHACSARCAGSASPREWVLHEAHPQDTDYSDVIHGNGLTFGDWKIVNLQTEPEPGWYGTQPPPAK